MKFKLDTTYIITGGGGGLRRAIAAWMVNSGAQKILFLSRSGTRKEAVRDLIRSMSKEGARIDIWDCYVGNKAQLIDALVRCQSESWPPFEGMVQGAMGLGDAVSVNQEFSVCWVIRIN